MFIVLLYGAIILYCEDGGAVINTIFQILVSSPSQSSFPWSRSLCPWLPVTVSSAPIAVTLWAVPESGVANFPFAWGGTGAARVKSDRQRRLGAVWGVTMIEVETWGWGGQTTGGLGKPRHGEASGDSGISFLKYLKPPKLPFKARNKQ